MTINIDNLQLGRRLKSFFERFGSSISAERELQIIEDVQPTIAVSLGTYQERTPQISSNSVIGLPDKNRFKLENINYAFYIVVGKRFTYGYTLSGRKVGIVPYGTVTKVLTSQFKRAFPNL